LSSTSPWEITNRCWYFIIFAGFKTLFSLLYTRQKNTPITRCHLYSCLEKIAYFTALNMQLHGAKNPLSNYFHVTIPVTSREEMQWGYINGWNGKWGFSKTGIKREEENKMGELFSGINFLWSRKSKTPLKRPSTSNLTMSLHSSIEATSC